MKKYFIGSDIHGEFEALMKNLKEQGFDKDDVNHILFIVGDLFDRGPQSDKLLEFCLDLWEKGRFIGVLGNHDEMLINFLEGENATFNLIHNGLDKTVVQLSGKGFNGYGKSFDEIISQIYSNYPKIMKFLKDLKDIYTFGDYVFTHAGYTETPFGWVVDNWAKTPRFIRNFKEDTKIYIFGHWGAFKLNEEFGYEPEAVNQIFLHNQFIGIDAFSNISNDINMLVMSETENGYEIELPIHKLTGTCIKKIMTDLAE